jgi:small GTP-binding protein
MAKIVKVVFAGQTDVGKSSIVHRFNHTTCPNTYPTVGAAFLRKRESRKGKTVDIDLWDTAGQERYKSLSSFYFRRSTYCFLVFDLNNRISFQSVDSWKRLCDTACEGNEPAPIYFLIGNKVDIGVRAISDLEIEKYCQNKGIVHYTETSAMNGKGISELYNILVDHIYTNKPSSSLVTSTEPVSSYCSC